MRNEAPFTSFFRHFLKIFFDLLYHQFAWIYDLVAWIVSLGQWRSWVGSILDDVPDIKGIGHILELGHGPGHLQLSLNHHGLKAIGLDESRWMSRLAYNRLAGNNYTPMLVNGVAERLPFASESFNHVVATFPSEYIFSAETLAETHRILASNGMLVILPFAWITGEKRLERVAAWLFKVTGQTPTPDIPIVEEKMKQPFRNAGFETTIEHRQLQSSMLLIIKAKKVG
jgi:ubiquinone/menaquinone biosynthesis C-methylase UbiE